jgi:large subunit ribosomal protein L22
MAFGAKTNERPGTRAVARHSRMSAYKAREVLALIRGKHVDEADEILRFVEREASVTIRKVLASAIANAQANDDQDPERLYVSACYADEGPTLKRWRPRARGRATRIRKRTCHITVIVSRMSDEDVARRLARSTSATAGSGRKASARASESRSSRVAKSRQRDADKAGLDTDTDDVVEADIVTDEATTADEATTDETTTDATTVDEAAETDEAATPDDVTTTDEDADEGDAEADVTSEEKD